MKDQKNGLTCVVIVLILICVNLIVMVPCTEGARLSICALSLVFGYNTRLTRCLQ